MTCLNRAAEPQVTTRRTESTLEHAGQTAGTARARANIVRGKGVTGSVRVVDHCSIASVEYDSIKHDPATKVKSVTYPFSEDDCKTAANALAYPT